MTLGTHNLKALFRGWLIASSKTCTPAPCGSTRDQILQTRPSIKVFRVARKCLDSQGLVPQVAVYGQQQRLLLHLALKLGHHPCKTKAFLYTYTKRSWLRALLLRLLTAGSISLHSAQFQTAVQKERAFLHDIQIMDASSPDKLDGFSLHRVPMSARQTGSLLFKEKTP